MQKPAATTLGRSQGKWRPVRWRSSLKNTIYDVLKNKLDWVETDSELDWDFFWADVGWVHQNLDQIHLAEHQRINHFPNHYELTRKDLLVKNLKRAKRQLEREGREDEAMHYNFCPTTFVVPQEYRMFVEEFKRSGGVWIMKPIGRAQGKGIFLFNKLSQISDWKRDTRHTRKDDDDMPECYIAQRYIDNPYLVGGKKFDLRIYVLVLSFRPLRVYLYRAGFARFSNSRFSMRKEDIQNSYVHLTNVAIQKHAPGYDKEKGMKWTLHSLKLYLTSKHGAAVSNELFARIQNIIIRSLLAVQPSMINDKHCFELYGYDIIIDADLHPWLLEVNASPSLTASDHTDYLMKRQMLEELLDVVDVEQKGDGGKKESARPEGAACRMGGFDLIWQGGPVLHFDMATSVPTMLACWNGRQS